MPVWVTALGPMPSTSQDRQAGPSELYCTLPVRPRALRSRQTDHLCSGVGGQPGKRNEPPTCFPRGCLLGEEFRVRRAVLSALALASITPSFQRRFGSPAPSSPHHGQDPSSTMGASGRCVQAKTQGEKSLPHWPIHPSSTKISHGVRMREPPFPFQSRGKSGAGRTPTLV